MLSKIFIIILIILIVLMIKVINEKKENFSTNSSKKIALCFLIYKEIYHEDIWYEYLKNVDKNKYNIYIHYKENEPLKHFEQYKLYETIETCWGCLSIVQAQNLILKEALKDPNNQHFIWLSDSCIPVKSFDYVYKYLDTSKSYFNKAHDSQVFPRANNALKYIDRNNIKKAAMPSILNRKHASIILQNNNISKWFKNINNVDEIVYITLIYHNNLQNELIITPNLAADAPIFTGWPDMSNYKLFKNSRLTKKSPNEYSYICPEELNYLISSKSLFARKFAKNCKGLDKLNNLLK